MLECHMNQLNVAGLVRGDDHRFVDQACQRTTTLPQEGNGGNAYLARGAGGGEQVRALAAGAVQNEKVVGPAERLDLPREDLLEAEVVPACRKDGAVGGKSQRSERPPIGRVADDVLRG